MRQGGANRLSMNHIPLDVLSQSNGEFQSVRFFVGNGAVPVIGPSQQAAEGDRAQVARLPRGSRISLTSGRCSIRYRPMGKALPFITFVRNGRGKATQRGDSQRSDSSASLDT